MAESATFALKAGVWFRRGRLLIVSPDSLGTACPLSGRNSTYRPVQISAAGSKVRSLPIRLVANPMRRVIMDEDGSPRLSDVPSGVSAGFPG